MPNRSDAIVETLPVFRRGALFVRQARDRQSRRNSPRGRAGRIGGLVTSRLYPAASRARDERGRFLAGVPAAGFSGARPAADSAIQPRKEQGSSRGFPAGHRPAGRSPPGAET